MQQRLDQQFPLIANRPGEKNSGPCSNPQGPCLGCNSNRSLGSLQQNLGSHRNQRRSDSGHDPILCQNGKAGWPAPFPMHQGHVQALAVGETPAYPMCSLDLCLLNCRCRSEKTMCPGSGAGSLLGLPPGRGGHACWSTHRPPTSHPEPLTFHPPPPRPKMVPPLFRPSSVNTREA